MVAQQTEVDGSGVMSTRAQRDALDALEKMRACHRDDGRWSAENFNRFKQMCVDAGVRFDADLCDEVSRALNEMREQIESAKRASETSRA